MDKLQWQPRLETQANIEAGRLAKHMAARYEWMLVFQEAVKESASKVTLALDFIKTLTHAVEESRGG